MIIPNIRIDGGTLRLWRQLMSSHSPVTKVYLEVFSGWMGDASRIPRGSSKTSPKRTRGGCQSENPCLGRVGLKIDIIQYYIQYHIIISAFLHIFTYDMGVSKNGATPNSFILMECPWWTIDLGVASFMETPISMYVNAQLFWHPLHGLLEGIQVLRRACAQPAGTAKGHIPGGISQWIPPHEMDMGESNCGRRFCRDKMRQDVCVCVSALYHMINWNYYIYNIYYLKTTNRVHVVAHVVVWLEQLHHSQY